MDIEAITNLLIDGSFDELIGVTEDGSIDFKREPYRLDTEAGKYELAKDAVAFANGPAQGLILMGVESQKAADSPYERAVRLRPIPRAMIDEERYRNIIRERSYPALRSVTVTSYEDPSDRTRALVGIGIPAQREEDKPFLVLSPVGPEGERIQGWLLGYPSRALDATEHLRASEVHGLLKSARTIGTKLDEFLVSAAGR
jgi:hypothetical protein